MCIGGGVPAAVAPAQTVVSRVPDGDSALRSDDTNRLRMIRAATILNNGSTSTAPSTTAGSGMGSMVGTKATLG